jgi:hypothetical protein
MDLSSSELASVEGLCEYCDERSDSSTGVEFLN